MIARMLSLAAALCLGAAATGQNSPGQAAPVNAKCPLSGKPVAESAGTVSHDGRLVGFCCPGCAATFEGWDEAKKTMFVEASLAAAKAQPAGEQAQAAGEQDQAAAVQGRPYTLDICAVSGEKLGSMGDPVVKQYDGREVRFCCDGCVDEFEADVPAGLAKVDEAMIKQQLMHYPLDTCAVRGGKLGSMGEPVNMIYDNRLVRFCCSGCVSAFNSDPEKYFAAMDKKIIAAQAPAYPMTDCPVGEHAHGGDNGGGQAGAEGGSYDVIYMNRLVRLCCEGCEWKLFAEPAKYLAKLDKAYADAQRASYPLKTCPVGGEELDDSAVEIVAGAQLVRLCCEDCIDEFKADPEKYLKKLREARAADGG